MNACRVHHFGPRALPERERKAWDRPMPAEDDFLEHIRQAMTSDVECCTKPKPTMSCSGTAYQGPSEMVDATG
jgi:hypothetical protein